MSWDHPSDRQLLRWTATGKGRSTARHALHCSLCERRLEVLTELGPQAKARFTAALAPSRAFEERLQTRVNQRLVNQETLAVIGDLMEVGPRTSWLLLEPHPEDEEDHE